MVRLDVRIEGTDSSLEVPAGPRSEIEASCGAEIDQRMAPSPRMEADIPRRLELDLDVQTGGARIDNFSTIDVDGSEIEAEGPADTLDIVSGDGIALFVDDGRLVVATTGGSAGFDVEVLDELPDEGEPQVLYLVPSEDPDVYDEYLWVSSSADFRKIGTTGIDLTGYVTDEELADAVADLVSDTDLAAALADYVTDSDLSTALAGKANASHTHAIADTTGLQSALDGKAASSHTHVKSDVTDLGEATSSSAGLMPAADKAKLDGIETGAQVNAVTGVKGSEESGYRVGNINLTPANIGAAESSHTHPNATTTAAGFMSADNLKTLQQMDIFRAVCTGVQNVGGTCVCTVTAYKGLLQVSNNVLLVVQFNAAWQTASAVELNIGASSNLTVCTVGAGGAWPPVSASNPLKWQTGSVMLFLCDWTNKKVLLLSRNLPIDAADIQTGTLDAARIPALPYLSISGGTLTGTLEGTDVELSGDAAIGGDVTDLSGNKLYADASHSHAIADVTSLQSVLDDKAEVSHVHAISDVTNLQSALDGKAASSHNHDSAYVNVTGDTMTGQLKFKDGNALPNAGTSTDFFAVGMNAFANGGRLAYKGLADFRTWLGLAALAYKASLAAGDIPSLDAGKIASGTFAAARIPTLDQTKVTPIYYQAHGSGNLSLTAGTITKVTLVTTGAVSSGDGLAIASGGIKVTTAGRYRVTAAAYVQNTAAASTGHGVYVKYATNGGAYSAASEILGAIDTHNGGSASGVFAGPKIFKLAANSILYLAARSFGAAGTCDQDNESTYLLVERLS